MSTQKKNQLSEIMRLAWQLAITDEHRSPPR